MNIVPFFSGRGHGRVEREGRDPVLALLDVGDTTEAAVEAEIERLLAAWPAARLLALDSTGFPGATRFRETLDLYDFDGYLELRGETWQLLSIAIRLVDAGYKVVPASEHEPVAGQHRPVPAPRVAAAEGTVPFTPREHQVIDMLLKARSTAQMARALGVSRSTVQSHVSHILTKTGCADRAQAMLWLHHHLSASIAGR